MAEATHDAAVAALTEKFTADELAGFIVRSLVPAGAVSEWDSETIELVLSEYEDVLAQAGLPWIGNTGANDENWEWWAQIAAELDYYTDFEFEEEKE